ncbi:pilus assembly PilX N-terminal domain-containing protein [Halalkalibacter akibai]|uniref:Type 4 fimbrial biogenesis protein PilX N-terminal domain-containing protein n=1 Tax=Halalkalibacter akibai (strain ATCC 43226 / DSM 21942 / CIP 109018 / JCM 9157 / 1139) TaxID=1236973 RepID=W4QST8_HALA3|nr:pilus assembly PilX N-terminal domain-containing protein [Halalkalibacter akibai]GAE34947.1 hypothetical protein JCM9157_2032 [Halalkalibacter akibai JCM 9157]
MKKYLSSESGAALILVLFSVVLLSAVGTMMLTTTTYSQKTIVNNEEIQEEFYRAEGAIEMALGEMGVTNSSKFTFLKDHYPSYNRSYTIGDEEVLVTVELSKDSEAPSAANIEKIDSINAKITARYLNNSKVSRTLEMAATETTIKHLSTYISPGKAINYVDSEEIEKEAVQNKIDKENIVNVDLDLYTNAKQEATSKFNLVNKGNLNNGSHYNKDLTVIESGVYGEISPPGGRNVLIAENSVVVVNKLELLGNNTLTVKGLLIVNNLYINGGPAFVIDSGIIANEINFGGNYGKSKQPFTLDGAAVGIDCATLPALASKCTSAPGGGVGGTTSTTHGSTNLSLYTNRN